MRRVACAVFLCVPPGKGEHAKMETLEELRAQLEHAVRTADDIHSRAEKENRTLTADETKHQEEVFAEAETLKKRIKELEDFEERRKKIEEAKEDLARTKPRKGASPEISDTPKQDNRPVIETPVRYGKLRAFANTREGEVDAYKSGMWLRAVLTGDYKAKKFCREHSVGVESRALEEGTNTAGGFIVPNEFTQAIIDNREQYGVFRQNCRIVPMGRDIMTIPVRTGGLTAYFVGEGSAATESDKTWGAVQLTARKLAVLTRYSTELAEDAIINIADDLADEMAYAFAYKEDLCGFTGDGTSTYDGIVGVATKFDNDNTLAGAVDCATSGHDLFSEIDASDLAQLMGTLPQYAKPNAKWYCSAYAKAQVFDRLLAAGGGNTMRDLEGAPNGRYLGYPIVVSQTLEDSTSAVNNAHMLLFGDLTRAAAMGDRRTITLLQSPHRYMEYDQIGLLATERVDIVVHDVGDTSDAGPIVALIGYTS